MGRWIVADLESMMQRIRGLLAKAESSTFASEQEIFMAKAQELMQKYAIEEELLWATEPKRRTRPIARNISFANKEGQSGNNSRATLLHVIARNSRCRIYFQGLDGVVHGFESDVNFVEMLYLSISTQMQMEMLREQAKTRINMRTFKTNFIRSYANRISERLYEAKNEYVPPSGSEELVLRNREEEVEEFYNEQTSHMRMRYTSDTSSSYNSEAIRAGRSAADKADLSAGRRGSTRELNR